MSRSEEAYAKLREGIATGRYPAGARLTEVDLSNQLGISRTPIRDALRRLQNERLVVVDPRSNGLVVASIDRAQVSELYAVREVLEGLAARLAAQYATPAEVELMRDVLERQRATPATDFERHEELNDVLHDVIWRSSRNTYLISILQYLDVPVALMAGTTYEADGRVASALSEHEALVEAIAARDAKLAEELAKQHIRVAERLRLMLMTRSTDQVTPKGKPAPRRLASASRTRSAR